MLTSPPYLVCPGCSQPVQRAKDLEWLGFNFVCPHCHEAIPTSHLPSNRSPVMSNLATLLLGPVVGGAQPFIVTFRDGVDLTGRYLYDFLPSSKDNDNGLR